MCRCAFVVMHLAVWLVSSVVCSSSLAADPKPEDIRLFESKIRPLLIEKCFTCHGPEKQKGGLRLDRPEGIAAGGDSGLPLVDAKKPESSVLLMAVRHAAGAPAMPPSGKLKDAEIADLAAWVKRGAPFPAGTKIDRGDGSRHWAFQPIRSVEVPAIAQPVFRSEIDRFVIAGLKAAGLKPASPTDKRTLIRRATFDLTGLPPTPEEIAAFLRDPSPNAFENVIDRLLASPAYGERWGRHWLDVARYADSNGLDENVAHGNAWRYRDYVIRAFNADKPYDRFLTEQIAGDLVPDGGTDGLIATGFLALGPKVLAEPDEKKMEYDIVDEQVDTIGRTILGLTLGCARCHDHKFDPITAADYTGLAGIFVSTRTMEHFKKVARWHENSLATPDELRLKADYDAKLAKLKAAIQELTGKSGDNEKTELVKRKKELAELELAAPELSSAMGVAEGKPTDLPVFRRGDHLAPGEIVPRRFPIVLAGDRQAPLPADRSGRLELARWITNPNHPLTARVIVNRVWRWHFGKGLVRSTDNFGRLGEQPTHPELLDWLAAQFVRDGWSLKKLHKRMMLTATYAMSSSHDANAATIDPDNRLLWRANPRRLEAEAIRDHLLAVSGRLDRTIGGPALAHVKNRGYLFDHTSKDLTTYTSLRRSVYLPVVRNNLYDVFQLFDAPDASVPNGDRATTTVPTQALFFLNSELVMQSAEALAGRVLADPKLDDTERVNRLMEIAYGRLPSADESRRFLASVAELESQFAGESDAAARKRQAWNAACQAVLASYEFIHLR